MTLCFFFFLIDYFGVEEKTGFCLLILKLARLLSLLLGLLVHLNLLHLWGGYHMQTSDTFVCPFPSTPHTQETCVVGQKAKDSAADW